MFRKEVLGIQAARLALGELAHGQADPLARDRIERIETLLSRIAANIGRREEFDQSNPEAFDGPDQSIAAACRRIEAWEEEVAAYDPRPLDGGPEDEALGVKFQIYLNRRFGDGAPVVDSLRRMPGGRSKHTLMVDLGEGSTLPRQIVLRTDSSRTLAQDSVANEYPAVAAIHRAGFPTPAPLWFEADETVLGAPFIIFERISGKPAGNLWGAFDGDGRAAHELGLALARLHTTPPSIIPRACPQSAREGVEDLLDGFEQRWLAARPDSSPVIAAAFDWLHARLDRVDGDPVIVHGDAHFSNMLMDGGRLAGLLDWEFWHFGHPAEDLAYCRPYVEATLGWTEFMTLYRDAGGPAFDLRTLELFAVWRPLRNAVLAAGVAHDFVAHEDLSLETAAIALATYPRLAAQVAKALAEAERTRIE